MNPIDLEDVFRGMSVPETLVDLANYQRARSDRPFVCDLRLVANGNADLQTFLAREPVVAEQFVIFAKDGVGSLYGYWLYDDKAIENAPLVFISSEWFGSQVVANNLREFLGLIGLGRRTFVFDAPPDDVPCPNSTEFRRWLSQVGIAVPDDPTGVVNRAATAHPSLMDFLSEAA